MASFGENLRKLRKERKLSMDALAEKAGTSKQVLSRYENGERVPKISMVQKLADALGVSISELSGEVFEIKANIPVTPYRGGLADRLAALALEESELPANVRPISALHHQRVPMIGEVAAGEPIYAPEDVGVYVDAPVKCDAAITIKGDSMVPNYLDGDVVYIKCIPDVHEGAVAVVFLDDEATLKHVYKRSTGLTLISDNPSHPPIMAEFEDYNNVRIFGVPVGFTRMFKPEPLAKVQKGFKRG